nr:MAG: replication associated protein [Cressdnaviricota sp.]
MSRSGCHWILTVPEDDWTPPGELVPALSYLRGQLEIGAGGFRHWQVYAVLGRKSTLGVVKGLFSATTHAELTRSQAARSYVWKEDTRVEGTQFELGTLPFRRQEQTDWDKVVQDAKAGEFSSIPSDVLVRCYHQLRSLRNDFAKPVAQLRECRVYWGPTGTGKSRRAWDEAGLDSFPKDPRTKWWDGYADQTHVIIDEFRGSIDIAHLLRWLDRYPVRVEAKGQSLPLRASKFWITSNICPTMWYPDLDDETKAALMRRLDIVHCPINMF